MDGGRNTESVFLSLSQRSNECKRALLRSVGDKNPKSQPCTNSISLLPLLIPIILPIFQYGSTSLTKSVFV